MLCSAPVELCGHARIVGAVCTVETVQPPHGMVFLAHMVRQAHHAKWLEALASVDGYIVLDGSSRPHPSVTSTRDEHRPNMAIRRPAQDASRRQAEIASLRSQ